MGETIKEITIDGDTFGDMSIDSEGVLRIFKKYSDKVLFEQKCDTVRIGIDSGFDSQLWIDFEITPKRKEIIYTEDFNITGDHRVDAKAVRLDNGSIYCNVMIWKKRK